MLKVLGCSGEHSGLSEVSLRDCAESMGLPVSLQLSVPWAPACDGVRAWPQGSFARPRVKLYSVSVCESLAGQVRRTEGKGEDGDGSIVNPGSMEEALGIGWSARCWQDWGGCRRGHVSWA